MRIWRNQGASECGGVRWSVEPRHCLVRMGEALQFFHSNFRRFHSLRIVKALRSRLGNLNEKLGSGLLGVVLGEIVATFAIARLNGWLDDLLLAAGEAAGWFLKQSTNPYIQMPLIGLGSLAVGLHVGRKERAALAVTEQDNAIEAAVGWEASLKNLSSFLRSNAQDEEQMYQGVATLQSYRNFCDNVCNYIAELFRQRMGDSDIACSIRLADDDGVEAYYTRGRSSNLSRDRDENTRPVDTSSGVYMSLCEASGYDQVLVLNDIDVALRDGTITTDYNLTHYRSEIGSMMVTRLNVRRGDTDALWGFLYISSPTTGAFSDELKPIVMAVADELSLAMWNVVESRRNGNGQSGTRRQDPWTDFRSQFIAQARKGGKARGRR